MAPKQKTDITDGSNTDPEVNKTTHQRYLERLAAEADAPAAVDPGRSFSVEDNDTSAYVGVSPEYQTYASETEKPLRAEEGTAQRFVEDSVVATDPDLLYVAVSGEAYREVAQAKRDEVVKQAEENEAKANESATPVTPVETF